MFNENKIYVLKVSGEEIFLTAKEARGIAKNILEEKTDTIIGKNKMINLSYYSSLLPLNETKTGKAMGPIQQHLLYKRLYEEKKLLK
jgi:hypothetical protein